ncbi:MAG TPA: hypothetical protein VHX61_11015 [Rhizomicrobium sp.]|jgi:hypothetical protein|nr:hypothetical protein [Rhizomicrobium sp.]
MIVRSAVAHLTDILEAIGNIRATMHDVSPEAFEAIFPDASRQTAAKLGPAI